MKYIAVLDSENEFTEEVINDLKNTGFLGDNPRYAFGIDDIQERKVGKWKAIDDTHSQCMGCGAIFCITSSNEWEVNYCPNCGSYNQSIIENER